MEQAQVTWTAFLLEGAGRPDNTSYERTASSSKCYNLDHSIISIASQLLLAVTAFVLNTIVIAIIFIKRKKTFKKPTFIFIAALASTDLLLAVCLHGFAAVSILKLQLSAKTWAYLIAGMSVCFIASINFLLVIALDRFFYITHNQSYKKVMSGRGSIPLITFLSWFLGAVPMFPLFFWNAGMCERHCVCETNRFLTCLHSTCSSIIQGLSKNFLFGLFFYFLIMFVLITTVYIALFAKVRRNLVRLDHSTSLVNNRSSVSVSRREFKLARTLAAVVGTFFLCWSPLMFLYVYDYVSEDDVVINRVVVYFSWALTILHSMLNPIIYAARIPLLRNHFRPKYPSKILYISSKPAQCKSSK